MCPTNRDPKFTVGCNSLHTAPNILSALLINLVIVLNSVLRFSKPLF